MEMAESCFLTDETKGKYMEILGDWHWSLRPR